MIGTGKGWVAIRETLDWQWMPRMRTQLLSISQTMICWLLFYYYFFRLTPNAFYRLEERCRSPPHRPNPWPALADKQIVRKFLMRICIERRKAIENTNQNCIHNSYMKKIVYFVFFFYISLFSDGFSRLKNEWNVLIEFNKSLDETTVS